MKRFLLTSFVIAAISCSMSVTAQDVVRLEHTYYTSYFSKSNHYPLLVEYTLTKKMLNCKSHAKSQYSRPVADPDLAKLTDMTEDYHLTKVYEPSFNMPLAANKCSADGYSEAYYFTNTTPRTPLFNSQLWSKVEKKESSLATKYRSVKVFTGSFGNEWSMGRGYQVIVPQYCWKVIYIPTTQEYKAYLFPNDVPVSTTLKDYETTVEDIQQRTGIRFQDGAAITNFQ